MFFNISSRKSTLFSKLCKQYVGMNNNYNNQVTADTFTLSSLPPIFFQPRAVLNFGRGMEV